MIQPMEEIGQTLADLGLAPIQIKILLFLGKTDCATVKDISKSTGEYRQEIYPALLELQGLGLVEQIIGRPNQYKSLPVTELLRVLLNRKTNWMSEIERKTTALIENVETKSLKKEATKSEYDFALITGMEKIAKAMAEWQNPAKTADYVIRYDQFDYQLGERIAPHLRYENNQNLRGRVVTCAGNVPFGTKNAEVRFTSYGMPAEISIYDGKRALLWLFSDRTNIFSKNLAILTSDHPSFVKMLQDYFDMLWKNAKPEKQPKKKTIEDV